MKITTKDFQILKGENVFEFPVGITVIQGKTGSGKSTLFYAVEDCLLNPSGVDDSIHWDCKQASVNIQNNGCDITWIKTKTSSEYINEQTDQHYPKASKINSSNLGDLGFYIDPNGDVVNIQSEWKKIFPFALKDTEMFKLFEDIFNISSSFLIIDDYKKDEQYIKSQINECTNNINKCTQDKTAIQNILSQLNIQDTKKIIEDLNTQNKALSEITQDYHNLSKNYNYEKYIIPEKFDDAILVNHYTYCKDLKESYNKYVVNHQRQQAVLPEIKTFDLEVNVYTEDYNKYKQLQKQIETNNNCLQQLDEQIKQLEKQKSSIKVCPTCGRPLE